MTEKQLSQRKRTNFSFLKNISLLETAYVHIRRIFYSHSKCHMVS